MQISLATTKKGEYVRLKDSDTAPVYVRNHYDAPSKRYSLSREDDMNTEIFRKGSTLVFVGFTY